LGSPDTATITIIDDDFSDPNQAVVEFGTPVIDIIEDVGQVSLTITRTGNTSSQVTVPWSTADGTAVAPGDYTPVANGSVSFDVGEAVKNINVTIIDDAIQEAMEHFTVNLGTPTATSGTVVLGAQSVARVGILDNDIKIVPMPKPDCGCGGDSDVIGN